MEHDAQCYNVIFESEFPDTKFLSAGNSSDVESHRLGFVAGIRSLARGCTILRLVDRDDHGLEDVKQFAKKGISVLNRRHLESYLFDDEVLTELCVSLGKPELTVMLLQDKRDAMAESIARGNPPDDLSRLQDRYMSKATAATGHNGNRK